MAKIKQKGKAGAAKAYVTRSAAVKRLQCSLADFRRLCILKGIFPREPRSRKKANKGSSAPTSFYYAKDIAYLAHEPVLKKLREHKAFAKKLSRALGRREWSLAESLEEHKPLYTLDHVIKERYPTFIDAVRDIDDALCMIFLFASLPSDGRVPSNLIENCSRLSAEWQLYIMHSRSLRKVFLSIKGVYYQAEVMDQTVTWLVPYQFTQNIPSDVDVRVMLTFLELYQTLLGFVLFKFYTDLGLVYPPPVDAKQVDAAGGVTAYSLREARPIPVGHPGQLGPGAKVTTRDIRQTIKAIISKTGSEIDDMPVPLPVEPDASAMVDEDFVAHPSSKDRDEVVALSTLQSISLQTTATKTNLFSPYTFFLSRETPRPLFEFIVCSFGGRIGWSASSGSGSPVEEDDPSITHVIIDRPVVDRSMETDEQRKLRLRRKYVQPQWIVDCVNAGKILLEPPYAQGRTLPPHLSPFGEVSGAYNPTASTDVAIKDPVGAEAEADEHDGDIVDSGESDREATRRPSGADLAETYTNHGPAEDPAASRTAELQAEAAGVDFDAFQKQLQKTMKKSNKQRKAAAAEASKEEGMNKMMMSNKKRKLYERVKHSQQKQSEERERLEAKRRALDREQLGNKRVGES